MKLINYSLLACCFFALTNCTIYRSPDRKNFESESSTFRTQNLVASVCSEKTIRDSAEASRLITILQNKRTGESQFLWEHQIKNNSYFETDNLKGVYCAFENN